MAIYNFNNKYIALTFESLVHGGSRAFTASQERLSDGSGQALSFSLATGTNGATCWGTFTVTNRCHITSQLTSTSTVTQYLCIGNPGQRYLMPRTPGTANYVLATDGVDSAAWTDIADLESFPIGMLSGCGFEGLVPTNRTYLSTWRRTPNFVTWDAEDMCMRQTRLNFLSGDDFYDLQPVSLSSCNPMYVVFVDGEGLRTYSPDAATIATDSYGGTNTSQPDLSASPVTLALSAYMTNAALSSTKVATLSFNNICPDQSYYIEVSTGGQELDLETFQRGFGLRINGTPRSADGTTITMAGNYSGYVRSLAANLPSLTFDAGINIIDIYWVQADNGGPYATLQGNTSPTSGTITTFKLKKEL